MAEPNAFLLPFVPWVLFVSAKHLFVAAKVGFTGALRRIGKSEDDGGAGRVRSRSKPKITPVTSVKLARAAAANRFGRQRDDRIRAWRCCPAVWRRLLINARLADDQPAPSGQGGNSSNRKGAKDVITLLGWWVVRLRGAMHLDTEKAVTALMTVAIAGVGQPVLG